MKNFIVLLMASILLITCGGDDADVIAGKYRFGESGGSLEGCWGS